MYREFVTYITTNHLGDVASVLAVVITVVGFFVAIYNVTKSKKAALRAEKAVKQVRADLARMNNVAEIASAITGMEEIKRLHRQEAWDLLLERYSAVRKALIAIRANMPKYERGETSDLTRHYRNAPQYRTTG